MSSSNSWWRTEQRSSSIPQTSNSRQWSRGQFVPQTSSSAQWSRGQLVPQTQRSQHSPQMSNQERAYLESQQANKKFENAKRESEEKKRKLKQQQNAAARRKERETVVKGLVDELEKKLVKVDSAGLLDHSEILADYRSYLLGLPANRVSTNNPNNYLNGILYTNKVVDYGKSSNVRETLGKQIQKIKANRQKNPQQQRTLIMRLFEKGLPCNNSNKVNALKKQRTKLKMNRSQNAQNELLKVTRQLYALEKNQQRLAEYERELKQMENDQMKKKGRVEKLKDIVEMIAALIRQLDPVYSALENRKGYQKVKLARIKPDLTGRAWERNGDAITKSLLKGWKDKLNENVKILNESGKKNFFKKAFGSKDKDRDLICEARTAVIVTKNVVDMIDEMGKKLGININALSGQYGRYK